MTRDQIREVFLAHGFTIKDGLDDLKPYVYEAAEALLAAQPRSRKVLSMEERVRRAAEHELSFYREMMKRKNEATPSQPEPRQPDSDVLAIAEEAKRLHRRRSSIVCGINTARACDKLDAELDALIDRLARTQEGDKHD